MSLIHKHEVIDALMAVLDEEHAQAVYEFRKVTKKTPLTAFGAKRLAGKFAQWPDPNEAACIMIDRCWQGFEVEWAMRHVRPQPKQHGITAAAQRMFEAQHGQEDIGRDHGLFQRLPAITSH